MIWGIAWWCSNIYLVCGYTMCVSSCQVEFVLRELSWLFYYRGVDLSDVRDTSQFWCFIINLDKLNWIETVLLQPKTPLNQLVSFMTKILSMPCTSCSVFSNWLRTETCLKRYGYCNKDRSRVLLVLNGTGHQW